MSFVALTIWLISQRFVYGARVRGRVPQFPHFTSRLTEVHFLLPFIFSYVANDVA